MTLIDAGNKKIVQKITQKLAQKLAQKITQKLAQKIAQKLAQKLAHKFAHKLAQKITPQERICFCGANVSFELTSFLFFILYFGIKHRPNETLE
ncbi:hypothetical protein ACSAZL_05635 [Methanosarcina sp. T3]|uniref:hypothetical protein n=1 Tax=Methanosarcina sp. T3 TaxID=3439062 RepID=UPI003F8725F4